MFSCSHSGLPVIRSVNRSVSQTWLFTLFPWSLGTQSSSFEVLPSPLLLIVVLSNFHHSVFFSVCIILFCCEYVFMLRIHCSLSPPWCPRPTCRVVRGPCGFIPNRDMWIEARQCGSFQALWRRSQCGTLTTVRVEESVLILLTGSFSTRPVSFVIQSG